MDIGRRSFLANSALLADVGEPARRGASRSLEARLGKAIGEMELADTHEHIHPEKERLSGVTDFFTLASHYVLGDVVSAGLPRENQAVIFNPAAGLKQRWEAFEPWWRHARFSGYSQALRLTVRELYGCEEISLKTLPGLNDAIRAMVKPGFFDAVLREKAGIRFVVVDDNWNAEPVRLEPDYFYAAHKFDRFVTPGSRANVAALEKAGGVSITTLGGLKNAAEASFARGLATGGMVAVKSTLAYNRTLEFEETGEAEAERDFERMMKDEAPPPPSPNGWKRAYTRPYKRMEDHMMHHILRLAEAHQLPVQLHTGILAGNGGRLVNTNPTPLTNLFFLYPRTPFDLFHISYPYQGELSVLAKIFPNVYANFCWAHIISPEVARRTLHEFLETIPVNKIFGFGGDYNLAELAYGHARLARMNVARVLAEKVEDGYATENEAVEIASLLLRENGERMYAPQRRA
jgi:predicted TIM-barrel fold metal-dependent hydrolase